MRRRTIELDVAIKDATAREAAAKATVAEIDAAEREIRFVKKYGSEERLAELIGIFEEHSLVFEEIAPGRFRLRQLKSLENRGDSARAAKLS